MIFTPRRTQQSPTSSAAGEGNYLASASDLMIGLLFVFIILVVVLAMEQRRQDEVIKRGGDPRGEVVGVLGGALGPSMGGAIRIDPASGVISLPESLLFELGKAELSVAGAQALRQAASALQIALPCFIANQRDTQQTCPQNASGHQIDTIFIEGHTDSLPMARANYTNTNLSLDRAQAVHKVLVEGSGLVAYRNKQAQPVFSFSAYADSRPLPNTAGDDSRNRRVDLRIVMAYRPLGELMNVERP